MNGRRVRYCGSSPLARGTLTCKTHLLQTYRFIPACAGNSQYSTSIPTATTVHPRLRGELAGRGLNRKIFTRFIPACAGNSQAVGIPLKVFLVHPRLRGELFIHINIRISLIGSSPLARGTRAGLPICAVNLGFIPACAGNSRKALPHAGQKSVHPRLRGELWRLRFLVLTSVGSSPLARGTPYPPNAPAFDRRFIPACAGNSKESRLARTSSSVHPRLRGELLSGYAISSTTCGSSPLARGTQKRISISHF